MEITPVREQQLGRLSEILSLAFSEIDSTKPWTNDVALKTLQFFYKIQPDLFLVALKKGQLVGGIMTIIKPWRDGNRCIEGLLFVNPSEQKKGMGRELFKTLLEKAISKYNVGTFEAITFANKNFPLLWYQKLGLKVDEDLVYLSGLTKDMLKELTD